MRTIDGEEKEKKSVFFCVFFSWNCHQKGEKKQNKIEVQVQASSANQPHVHLRLKDVRDV